MIQSYLHVPNEHIDHALHCVSSSASVFWVLLETTLWLRAKDRQASGHRHHNSSLLLSDSTVTCPFSDSSLLGLAYCFAKTCPTPSRDVQDEGPTELEPSVYPQLIGQKPLLSAVPGRFWPQMACLQERCGRISVLRLSCTGLGMKWSLSSTPCVFQMRKQRPACSQNSVKCFFHHSRTSERTCTVSPT